MEKFLKVGVTKTVFSELYIRVDDQDPAWQYFFNKDGTKIKGKLYLPPKIAPELLKEAIGKTMDDFDWDDYNAEYNTMDVENVSKEEATSYKVYDLDEKDIYKS